MTALQSKWEELADIKDELAARDWFMGTSGNLAIKVSNDPLQFLVTASGKDKKKRTKEDFLLVNTNGHSVEKTRFKAICRNITALCHIRTKQLLDVACMSIQWRIMLFLKYTEMCGKVDFQGQELIKAFGLWEEDALLSIPIIPNHAHIPSLAEEFRTHIHADKGAVLIRNHGITVWGKDGFEAKKLLEACEFLFQYQLALLK